MAEVGSSAIFREDRSWMYTGHRSRDSITPEWAEKTTEFVERAFRRVSPDHAARGVLCPCARCRNTRPRSKYDMQMHLCKNGFRPGYTVWVYHGESLSSRPPKPSDDQPDENGDLEGKEDAELADFWGEEEEVSSKPQGALKKEISLIQSYAYSKLRKEDRIEWDYQKYLWEKEKLQPQQNVSNRQGLHPEVDDPIQEETDEALLIMSGHGKEHGRYRMLNAVIKPTTILTHIRATLTADHPPIAPPRQPCRCIDPDFEEAYKSLYADYIAKYDAWCE